MQDIPIMKTINQLSAEFTLPKNFIRSLVLQNKIVYVKAGKKYLINANSLRDFLNKGE